FVIPRLLSPTLFPYTTLFRSRDLPSVLAARVARLGDDLGYAGDRRHDLLAVFCFRTKLDRGRARRVARIAPALEARVAAFVGQRSEEHTSELQSRENLVCRLL